MKFKIQIVPLIKLAQIGSNSSTSYQPLFSGSFPTFVPQVSNGFGWSKYTLNTILITSLSNKVKHTEWLSWDNLIFGPLCLRNEIQHMTLMITVLPCSLFYCTSEMFSSEMKVSFCATMNLKLFHRVIIVS